MFRGVYPNSPTLNSDGIRSHYASCALCTTDYHLRASITPYPCRYPGPIPIREWRGFPRPPELEAPEYLAVISQFSKLIPPLKSWSLFHVSDSDDLLDNGLEDSMAPHAYVRCCYTYPLLSTELIDYETNASCALSQPRCKYTFART